MKKNDMPRYEIAALAIGEALVAAAAVAVYLIIDKFSYSVVTGLALGIAVTLVNFIILSVTAGRAVDRIMQRRPEGELDEDAAADFAAKNQAELQNAVKKSFIIRNLLLIATLVLAFLLKNWFDVIATVLPLLAYSPILSVAGMIKRRSDK